MRILAWRILAVAAALAGPSTASAEELVKFETAPPSAPGIRGYMTRPNGEGPFPAVVLLHSCLGLPPNRRSIANELARWGYVALFVDDFATRDIKQTCAVDFSAGVSDAFGALLFLSRLPYVDPTRIAAVGYSQGADTALAIASSRRAPAAPHDLKFKVAAAYYPPCENRASARLEIPTLILIGALDDVTPAADCQRLARNQPGDRPDVKLVVYPDASHGFDNPAFANGVRQFGMRLEYNRTAAEKSTVDLRDFLSAKLAR